MYPTSVMAGEEGLAGSFFNDFMKAIIPNWDNRAQFLKDIKFKPKAVDALRFVKTVDPKLAAKAQKVFVQQGEQAVVPYLESNYEAAKTNPIVWVGGGILVLLLVGTAFGSFGGRKAARRR